MEAKNKVAILAAASYMSGPIAKHLKTHGYAIVAIIRPSTNTDSIPNDCEIKRGNLSDMSFIKKATEGCVAIINFLNQLMPPRESIREQLENDLPPLECGLRAALEHDCMFIHTSGNFSIPSAGRIGGVFTNELTKKEDDADVMDENSWRTFEHEGGMTAVATLAEAKHRQDHVVQDFIHENPNSKAMVIIPAGIYGPGLGSKYSFWDLAAKLYLEGQFVDFAHAFVHIDDACLVYQKVIELGEAGGRYPVYGESMTVRNFVSKYAAICNVPINEDGPVCSEEEAKRVYDDSFTLNKFGIEYAHTLDNSLSFAIESLTCRGLLLVQPNE